MYTRHNFKRIKRIDGKRPSAVTNYAFLALIFTVVQSNSLVIHIMQENILKQISEIDYQNGKGQEYPDFCHPGTFVSFPDYTATSSGTSGNGPVGPENSEIQSSNFTIETFYQDT